MRKVTLACAIFLLSGVTAPVVAEEDSGFSANVTLASDYSFRGWSQTTRDPAIQGGFDYDFGNGFSIGTWGSNINFGASTTMEWDLYMGFGGSMNESTEWSASLIRFEYPSEGDALDYIELHLNFAISDLSFGIAYSPDYLGDGGPTFFYPNAGYSMSLGESAALDVGIGMSMTDEDSFFADGEDSYIDYSATVTVPFEGLDLAFGLVGTNLDSGGDTDPRLVLSLSKSF
ncbi:MAG: TorF family putative porin [Gammaproteobacteria bacterium]|nr:TorF family putative porin [Gammaproteobacteria bacterium]